MTNSVPKSRTSSATSPAERGRARQPAPSGRLRGFPPQARADARVLILGSMPGSASLRAAEYYAHPHNAFWRIMGALFGTPADAAYAARIRALIAHRVALWDVLAACRRPGSLDARIDPGSIVVNDFASFLRHHAHVQVVYFNGATAERLYRRHVLPRLDQPMRALPGVRLPSTSPAHAARSFAAKLAAWSVLLDAAG